MYRFLRKSCISYIFCLTITIGFLSFSYNTITYQSTDSIIISSSIFKNTQYTFNVTFDQKKCNGRRDISSRFLSNLSFHDEIFNYLGFVVRSHSLFYCSVPKVATRTLLLLLTYLHIRDDLIPLLSNNSKSDLVNFPIFNQLISSSIKNNPNATKFDSISILQFFLSQLELSNSSKIDLWSIYQNKVFHFIRLRSLSNPSILFSSNYIRAIFVRHPFERLASAYIDKIASLNNQPFSAYDNVRREICRKYSSFYLKKNQKNFREACSKIIPTFQHFIEYVMSDYLRDDVHWKPYSSLCHVCLFQYNFIGKFETIQKDLENLIKYLGLNSTDWIRKDYFQTGKTKDNYKLLYSNLNDKTICYLKDIYKNDFKLFDYRLEDYLSHNRTIKCSATFFKKRHRGIKQ